MNNKGTKSPELTELLESQRTEIAKHKWIESEKAGRDIGWQQASTEWFQNHFNDWVSAQKRAIHRTIKTRPRFNISAHAQTRRQH